MIGKNAVPLLRDSKSKENNETNSIKFIICHLPFLVLRGTDLGGVPAGGGTQLPADTAVWAYRANDGADGGKHPERMAAAGDGIGTGYLSERCGGMARPDESHDGGDGHRHERAEKRPVEGGHRRESHGV